MYTDFGRLATGQLDIERRTGWRTDPSNESRPARMRRRSLLEPKRCRVRRSDG